MESEKPHRPHAVFYVGLVAAFLGSYVFLDESDSERRRFHVE